MAIKKKPSRVMHSRARIRPEPTLLVQPTPNVVDDRGAAKYVGVTRATLRLWRANGEGPPFFKAGKRLVRYRRVDLDNWIAARTQFGDAS